MSSRTFPSAPCLAPIHGKPPGYVFEGLLASADWLTRALDIQGFRLDFVKGISTDFLSALLQHGALKDTFAVGEFFDGNVALVHDWVANPRGMHGRASAFDFPLRGLLCQMCNNAGSFDMSQLDNAGLVGIDPQHAVTFVENHDTDTGHGPIFRNKPQAYAYILTSEGYPCVYYKDYSTDPGCYGMKKIIDNLIWIHEKLANGPTQRRWKDHDVFAYERLGGPHLLVGLNNHGELAAHHHGGHGLRAERDPARLHGARPRCPDGWPGPRDDHHPQERGWSGLRLLLAGRNRRGLCHPGPQRHAGLRRGPGSGHPACRQHAVCAGLSGVGGAGKAHSSSRSVTTHPPGRMQRAWSWN